MVAGLESCEKSIMAEVSKDKHAAVQQVRVSGGFAYTQSE